MSTNPITKTYKVMHQDNSVSDVTPDEIESVAKSKYSDYKQSGPNPENQEELLIKQSNVHIDQN